MLCIGIDRQGPHLHYCLSPKGEEEPVLKGAERGGYSPIPRRDARVGEWGFWQCFSGAELAAAARATEGSESLSVNMIRVNSDEQSATNVEEYLALRSSRRREFQRKVE
ncbi:MAG TPA: hypothetical protein PKY15_07285 [Methanoregulaceae archaeon]|nr:hypothetical protein [Methanoregulaceae archaeon]